ncbi:MAG: saccharopine dehydrogenase NADP-binding domain-containing protein, partial [Pseudomonadota bacterium]
MKVVIVGGYGVFGSLTARLLVRDGHQLWLAGRRPEKARALARELGAQTIAFDITTAQETLFAIKPDVVIDAAGPFQHYGNDPYRLPRLCIAHGCHYLDLSDSTA